MAVSSLREITVGVQDLHARTTQFEQGCGLTVMTSGSLSPMTASRLFDTHVPPRAAVLGRSDVADSPRIRLVEAGDGPRQRAGRIDAGGPLGIAFTTRDIGTLHTRLSQSGVEFLSPPLRVMPTFTPPLKGAASEAERLEAFGRMADGDFIVLAETVNASTPYGTVSLDCSEPLDALFVVTNLDACHHFMRDVMEHEAAPEGTRSGPPLDALLGLSRDISIRFATPARPGWPSGRLLFMEFERKLSPMAQLPALARGLCRLRYDTTDLHATLSRVPGGGGSLVRGPASVDDPVLGNGLVAMVRAPFGVLIEIWQTQ